MKAFNIYIEGRGNSAEEIFNKVGVLKAPSGEPFRAPRRVAPLRNDYKEDGLNFSASPLLRRNHEINITPYWLLGFVEGDGS